VARKDTESHKQVDETESVMPRQLCGVYNAWSQVRSNRNACRDNQSEAIDDYYRRFWLAVATSVAIAADCRSRISARDVVMTKNLFFNIGVAFLNPRFLPR